MTDRTAWLEIDCAAYRHNLKALSDLAGVPVVAVIKANGYGHGMELMAREATAAGCAAVAVAVPAEGVALREAGHAGRILVLAPTLEEEAAVLVEHELEPTVTRPSMLEALARAAEVRGTRAPLHVKVDTGMSRVGVGPEEALAFCARVRSYPDLKLAGVMTHFACADEPERPETAEQWSRFAPLVEALRAWEPRPVLHAANSAAALWFPETRLDWVRGGLLTYGVSPTPRPLPLEVRPVASLKARVVQLKEIEAGRSVSYGGTWTAPRRTRLALIALGYADGYAWVLANRGEALLRGRRVPIRGRVCMDQILLDVTDLPGVEVGETAVFMGRQGEEEIRAEHLAEQAGTIPYEILTRLAARLPRLPRHGAG